MKKGLANPRPRVSIIMPSYNQAQFIERSIVSILNQDYPALELIVIDGGSTDGSVEIIEKYANHIKYWVSESDRGQSDAINKGLRRATGEWVGWQNSDDMFCPGGIRAMIERATHTPHADLVIGDMCLIDEADQPIREMRYVRPTYHSVLAEGMVLTNQSALWRRSAHDALGWLNENLHYGFDFEWFLRLLASCRAVHVARIVGCLRLHDQTKTALKQPEFDGEYARIRAGHPAVGEFEKRLYALRRAALYVLNGQVSYVLRGLRRRSMAKPAQRLRQ